MIFAKDILTKKRIDDYIESCMARGERATFNEFCSRLGFARSHSCRVFTAVNGFPPGPYISAKRDEFIKSNSNMSALDICIGLGISTTQVWRRARAMGIEVGGK